MLMMPICQSKLLNRTESFSKWPETGWCSPHLQKDPLNKENYKPLSLLSLVSKVFERLLYKQIETIISNKLSAKLPGLRKNYKHSIVYDIC